MEITETELREMRGWIADCGIGTRGMSDHQVIRLIARCYEGGLAQFHTDCEALWL